MVDLKGKEKCSLVFYFNNPVSAIGPSIAGSNDIQTWGLKFCVYFPRQILSRLRATRVRISGGDKVINN